MLCLGLPAEKCPQWNEISVNEDTTNLERPKTSLKLWQLVNFQDI